MRWSGEIEGNIHSIAFNPLWNTKRGGGLGVGGRNIDLPPSYTCRVNRPEIEAGEYRTVGVSTCARDGQTDGN